MRYENNSRIDIDVTSKQIKDSPCHMKHAGPYILGPLVRTFWESPFTLCIARKPGTNHHYLMKILLLKDDAKGTLHKRALFHSEYTFLTMLRGQEGVVQLHDFFSDSIMDEETGKEVKRMCMVTECFMPHGEHNPEMVLLAFYIRERKRLVEWKALTILHNLLTVLDNLHKMNFVHGDLKATNIVVNRRTLKIKLINIYHGKLWGQGCETTPPDTPEIIIPRSCRSKSYDVWSVGVVLYIMVHGYLPFVSSPAVVNWLERPATEFYDTMIKMDYEISSTIKMSDATKLLINSIFCKNPLERVSCTKALEMTEAILLPELTVHFSGLGLLDNNSINTDSQVVPQNTKFKEKLDVEEKRVDVDRGCQVVPLNPKKNKIVKAASRGKKRKFREDDASVPQSLVLTPEKSTAAAGSDRTSRTQMINNAMLRLGATAVHSIQALSFQYPRRSSTHLEECSLTSGPIYQ